MLKVCHRLTFKGQSLMELVVGISLIALVISAIAVITAYSLRNSQFSKNQAQATHLAQQNLERVRTIKSSNYMICLSGQSPPACPSWEEIWARPFGAGEEYRISTDVCTLGGVIKPCLQYKGPNSTWDLENGFSGEIIIKDEVNDSGQIVPNQKRAISRIYWTDTTGKHSSDLVTIFSKI